MQFVIVIGILWYGLEQAKASGTYGVNWLLAGQKALKNGRKGKFRLV